ncbi:MAG: dihydroneopterin aldolase [Bacteroides sp.]|nr:dihydroneopterin aldolase [Bacteroides sp.]
MTSYIFLDSLRFFARHGVGEQETVVGNEFIIDLRLKVDIRHAMQTDDVADTVSYADVYTAVKEEMDIPSRLLEHVSGRIVRRLFRDFLQIEEITLKLAKRNPPMGADIEAAGIELCLSRYDAVR